MIVSKPKVINNKYARMAKRCIHLFEKHHVTYCRMPHAYVSIDSRWETIKFVKNEPGDRYTSSAPERELFSYWDEKQNRPAWGINYGVIPESEVEKIIDEMQKQLESQVK